MAEDADEQFILLKRKSWRELKARVQVLETNQQALLEQIASMHAALLYPNDLEARVTASRAKYRELCQRLGYPIKKQN
jgi:uncharacterized protein involved in exopolysaccharide biosynthesis